MKHKVRGALSPVTRRLIFTARRQSEEQRAKTQNAKPLSIFTTAW